MEFSKIHHIAIIGSDYEASKDFYVNKLGFSVIRENYRAERKDYKIDLQLDDLELELFIIADRPARPNYPEAYGLRHLAFRVDSVQETVEEQSGSLAGLQETVDEQTSLFSEYLDGLCERFDSDEEILSEKLDENLLVMKAVSKQLDTLIELAGEILEETGRRQSNDH